MLWQSHVPIFLKGVGMGKKIIKQKLVSVAMLVVSGLVFLIGCAQVPREAVELSTTVGRDITQVYQSHRELAILLFGRMKNDVNEFVDTVYAPYQIQKLLKADYDDFKAGEKDALFYKLNFAVNNPGNNYAQLEALEYAGIIIEVIRDDIELFRQDTLAPVLKQEEEVLAAIDRSYNQIHYANSIVNGHLASIVKVHDAQEELLNDFGLEGLRKDIGESLAVMSAKVAEFTKEGKKIDTDLDDAEDKINEWQTKFNEFFEPGADNS
jgi:hypothetical protein